MWHKSVFVSGFSRSSSDCNYSCSFKCTTDAETESPEVRTEKENERTNEWQTSQWELWLVSITIFNHSSRNNVAYAKFLQSIFIAYIFILKTYRLSLHHKSQRNEWIYAILKCSNGNGDFIFLTISFSFFDNFCHFISLVDVPHTFCA